MMEPPRLTATPGSSVSSVLSHMCQAALDILFLFFTLLPHRLRTFCATWFVRFVRVQVESFWGWVSHRFWINRPYARAQDGKQVMDGVQEVEWQFYGPHPLERVHILRPATDGAAPASKPKTAVLYIHGGGFVFASSQVLLHSVTVFCRQGFHVFSIDYPLAPEDRFPTPVISVLRALSWLKTTHGVEKVMLFGDSAGGNLASLAAAFLSNPRLLASFTEATHKEAIQYWEFPKVECLCCMYGLLDQTSWRNKRLKQINMIENFMAEGGIGGALYLYRSPENVFGNRFCLGDVIDELEAMPRTLFIGGSRDPLVYSTISVHSKLLAKGFDVHCKIYPARHGFFGFPPAWTFGAWLSDAKPATALIVDFFQQTRKGHRRTCSLQHREQDACCRPEAGDFGVHAMRAYDKHFASLEAEIQHVVTPATASATATATTTATATATATAMAESAQDEQSSSIPHQ
eukprot:m.251768 g.251768  ORF g.251768 m.251768 type:complete len:460 (+) comp15461_c0_seq2:139-1518(+)